MIHRKHFIFVILLVALCIVGITSVSVYPSGHNKDAGGPGTGAGGTAQDCLICHDFLNGIYGGGGVYGDPAPPVPPAGYNLRWVRTLINGRTVNFLRFSGPPADGTLADGASPYDGACEVCHTTTRYHRNDGTGDSHNDATNCVSTCHPHFLDDLGIGKNYFDPQFPGNQSHYTHFDDPKGPQFMLKRPGDYCTYYCHSTTDFELFKDELPLETTTVCDPCHGNYGPYDGVGTFVAPPGINPDPKSVAYGAKQNWQDGIYEAAVAPAIWPRYIKAGKEDWCAGCHDTNYIADGIPNQDSVIFGVTAPNVMGDDTLYGYNVNGHGPLGVTCAGPPSIGCHNTEIGDGVSANHTDGYARTYADTLNNYQLGYRLNTGMIIPRFGEFGPTAFELCWQCHTYSDVFGSESFFRYDGKADPYLHEVHLGQTLSATYAWDSDWSGGYCPGIPEQYGVGCDSAMSCTACHNVHGTPCLDGSPPGTTIISCSDPLKTPMIRHGELISTPGTKDKVPSLRFNWYSETLVPTTDFDVSRWGGLVVSNSDVTLNGVCWGCHLYNGENKYHRGPCGVRKVSVTDVWTSDTSNTAKDTFYPGETIRYHVRFDLSGTDPIYWITEHGLAQKVDNLGPKHEWTRQGYLSTCNTYEFSTDKLLPSGLNPPPEGFQAKVTITVEQRDVPYGTLYSTSEGYAFFLVVSP